MSLDDSGQNVVMEEETSQFVQDLSSKAYSRMDLIDKLKLINDMDNGQCKADIAKKYGVHSHTINYVYKQKESILRRYTQVCNILVKDVRCVNLDKTLLEWFNHETNSGKVINEDKLRTKALDTIAKSNEDFICTDDWLLDFRLRHNIAKYASDIECSVQAREEWQNFLKVFDAKDVYLGGVCALSHSLDFNKYASGQDADSYVSLLLVTNTHGTDKRELAVIGQDTLDAEVNLRSLPVNYYYCDIPQVNNFVIHHYLKKWDYELIVEKRFVSLLLNVPDKILEQLNLQNIKIVSLTNMNYVTKILEKLIECFKFHYRKFQISKIIVDNDCSQQTILDHIHMISTAWYNVSCTYIQLLSHPLADGTLYFNVENGENYSLSKWCKTKNILLNTGLSSNMLDKYIFCDEKLPCLSSGQLEDTLNTREILFQPNSQSTSGIEAYQAMKRLLSYLQGEHANCLVIKYAKLLENHVEYGALLQIHQIITSAND